MRLPLVSVGPATLATMSTRFSSSPPLALSRVARTLTRLALAAAVALAIACGDDDPTGPAEVTFPDWPAPAINALCVRGTALVGDTKSGTISVTDCDGADVNPDVTGYFETWRVRVASAGDVTFDATSSFDNFLTVLRVNSVTASGGSATIVADNDNRSQTDLNALVTLHLEPNVDYVVGISGFDEAATGAYTLVIR